MIILSDGDASGAVTVNGQADQCELGYQQYEQVPKFERGNFPSYKDMCQQGIAEAAAAKSAGTKDCTWWPTAQRIPRRAIARRTVRRRIRARF